MSNFIELVQAIAYHYWRLATSIYRAYTTKEA